MAPDISALCLVFGWALSAHQIKIFYDRKAEGSGLPAGQGVIMNPLEDGTGRGESGETLIGDYISLP